MFTLILLLVTSSILVYVSQSNSMLVSLSVGPYVISNIPLFFVIIGSLLTGLILSYIIQLANEIANSLTMREMKKEMKKKNDEVLELTKRVHQLELENEKLKNNTTVQIEDPNAL